MTIVLDAGALIAAERGDPRLAAVVAAARKFRNPILLPAPVIAETWRGSSTHPRSARLMKIVDTFPPLDETTARRVGALLTSAAMTAIVDGTVAEVAIAARPSTIVTSDPIDIERLLATVGITYERFTPKTVSTSDVVIFTL